MGDHAAALPTLQTVAAVDLVAHAPEPVYIRFSAPPPEGLDERSVDHRSGLTLPGLAVNPLSPPAWWGDRRVEEWVVRRVCTYAHLQDHDADRVCWLLHGTVADRGPDNEPLVVEPRALAIIAREVVATCKARDDEHAGRAEDEPEPGGAAPWQSK